MFAKMQNINSPISKLFSELKYLSLHRRIVRLFGKISEKSQSCDYSYEEDTFIWICSSRSYYHCILEITNRKGGSERMMDADRFHRYEEVK